MKTSIQSLIALSLTAVVLTSSAFVTKAADHTPATVLSEVKKVNKINVAGNVELILVQSANESVKVYDNYFSKNALVQQKDGELRISSFNKETLTVVAYVSNLSAIFASDNATVKTYGKFNTLSLDVTLTDQATAILNTNTVSMYAQLNGNSSLSLTGTTTDYNAVMGNLASVSMSQFVATSTNIQSKSSRIVSAKKPNAIVSLEDLNISENS